MPTSCRSWWRNCAFEADSEIQDIDRMEDGLASLSQAAIKVRELISTLELCHHKAERWIDNIIAAIGAGDANKGLGSRPSGQLHPAELVWQNACAVLSAWLAGCPVAKIDLSISGVPAPQMLAGLGERSTLKEWQVRRVVDKIRSLVHWPQPLSDSAAQYVWLLFSGGEGESLYCCQCPEYYQEHEDFWRATVRTSIHDVENGNAASLSLGLAIDMLWPCHWLFVENLQLVLEAIGGNLHPEKPFAACGRNIILLPIRNRMETISRTLKSFCGGAPPSEDIEEEMLAQLGEPTELRRWLASSLEKTIRLQINPPAEMRAISALAGPEWIYEK